jgi:flagellar motor switch protein FliN
VVTWVSVQNPKFAHPYGEPLNRHTSHFQKDKPVPTLDNVALDIQVVLGTTSMPIHQVLRLGRGAIIELEASEDDEVVILANNFKVATGAVIVSGNRIAVEVKEMAPKSPDVR